MGGKYMYQFFPYIILSVISFLTLVTLAVYVLHNRQNLAVKEFILAVLTLAWWVFCQAFELMAMTLPVKLFWANLLYPGAALSSFAYLMVAMRYTGYERFLTKKNITIISSISLVFFVLIFTDQYHGLMRTNLSLDTSSVPYTIDKDYGMLFPLYMLFAYGMNGASMVLILLTAIKKHSVYRKKAQILLVGVSIIPLSNMSYILGLSPVSRFDMTPALFWLSALIVSWGIFQNKLLNIMPIARDLLVERISSGIVVVDNNDTLVDINDATLKMFELQRSEIIGKNIAHSPQLADNLPGESNLQKTITYYGAGKRCIYEVRRHPLNDNYGRRAGTLWVIEDITERQNNLEKLVQQEKTLTVMSERERLARSLHDGLGQVFGYYNTQGQAVKEYLLQQKYPAAIKHLEDLIDVSRNHHLIIREQISDIRGVSFVNKSFTLVLKQYSADYSEKHGIPVKVVFDDSIPASFPDDETAVELLRIIQEALNNVQKHAGACTVEVGFKRKVNFVEVSISDSGAGFNPLEISGSNSYGLSIMRERATEIGATMTLDSEKDKGTEIVFKIWDGEQYEDSNCR